MLALQGGPEGGGAEFVAYSFGDFQAADLAETGEDFFLREDGFEEVEIFFKNLRGLIEDDEEQAGVMDEGIGFHFAEIFDDGLAPL